MKVLSAIVAALLLILGASASADDSAAIAQAQNTAKDWLILTDSAKYSQSWEEAASIFKGAISRSDWEKAVMGVRSPLGAVKSRKVKSATMLALFLAHLTESMS